MDGDAATLEAAADEPYDVEMDFVGSLEVQDSLGKLEPTFDDEVSELLLQQLGHARRGQRRDAKRAGRRIVSEVYSPPRVTKLMREMRTRYAAPGFAFDLTTVDPDDGQPWDFNDPAKRAKARRMLREQRPFLIIGSPMCRYFSTWQRLNEVRTKDPAALARAKAAAIVHLDFMAELYHDQLEAGNYFLHEHPLWASSWEVPSMQAVLRRAEVQRVHGDQCQFGAEIRTGVHRGDPVKKPTGFMTNSPAIARILAKMCAGRGGECSRPTGGKHFILSGSHTAEAAKYPRELCQAVLRGVRDQLREDGVLKNGCFGVQARDDEAEIERNLRGSEQGYSGKCKDDLTGQVLKDELVHQARAAELAHFHSKGVWLKIPKQDARRRSRRPPISVRWVDVNKGDDINPKYRSRLVARQLKARDNSGQSFFAPAPPLEALRTVVSMAVTTAGEHRPILDPHSPHRSQISLVDVKRAYFNAKIDPREPPTFVDLPPEDGDCQHMCAQLLRHMYGTRGAADGWQEEYSTTLVRLGFRQGEACPNVFRHEERKIITSVHGDDFTSSGAKDSLDWLEAALAEEYELDVGPRLGPGPEDKKEGRALNRVIRWMDDRIQYEADPRQVERLVAECGLQGANGVATPGVKATFKELEEDQPLPARLTTAFRGAAARGNYLAADRLDLQFACKEVCRWMAAPTQHAWTALKRICRFLCQAPRLVHEYRQQTVEAIDVYTDTDWSGCPKTRKSTSGGCVMVGTHAVKHWSSTQASIALSSGEAEFAGVIRGAGQGLGYQALLRDLGIEMPLRVWTGSSAAIGVCSRQGLGKLRHLDTHMLWIQQAVRTRRVDLRKVLGEQNPADLLTKHSISRQRLSDLVSLYGCRYLGGRAESAPLTRKGASGKVTMADAERMIGNATGDDAAPVMPHLDLGQDELDAQYPPLQAPAEQHLEDLQDDHNDCVYQAGLKVASEVTRETQEFGRRRRPPAAQEEDTTDSESKASLAERLLARLTAARLRRLPAGPGPLRRTEVAPTWSSAPRRSAKYGTGAALPSEPSQSVIPFQFCKLSRERHPG